MVSNYTSAEVWRGRAVLPGTSVLMRVTANPRLRQIGALVAVLVTAGCGQLGTDVTAPATAQLGKQWAIVDRYCVECHNDVDLAGGFAFDAIAAQSLGENAEVWEKATRKLRGRLMPPPNGPQPSEATVRSLVATVEGALDDAASANPIYEGVGCIGSIARNTRTPSAICSRSRSIAPVAAARRCSAKFRQHRGARCRFRRRSSSSTSRRPVRGLQAVGRRT